jgi:uncharacterized membrane protein YeaQ/YmgE (transglycosylase-associated protein family)
MSILIWFVVGGLVGWVASKVTSTDGPQGFFLNVVVGSVGGLLGGAVLSPIVDGSTIDRGQFGAGGFFVSLVGAVALLAIMNFVTHRRAS